MLIPHQANLRISQFIQKRFGLSDDQVYNNIQKYGNTTAASIPIALSEAHEQGKVKEGDTRCFSCFWKWIHLGKCDYKMVNMSKKKHPCFWSVFESRSLFQYGYASLI